MCLVDRSPVLRAEWRHTIKLYYGVGITDCFHSALLFKDDFERSLTADKPATGRAAQQSPSALSSSGITRMIAHTHLSDTRPVLRQAKAGQKWLDYALLRIYHASSDKLVSYAILSLPRVQTYFFVIVLLTSFLAFFHLPDAVAAPSMSHLFDLMLMSMCTVDSNTERLV